MVKRQTVWLSTMMVLSLMLIGYYTLGTPSQPGTNGVRVTTGTGVSPSSVPTTAQTSNSSVSTSGNDWFVNQSMQQQKDESALISTLQSTMADSRISNSQATKAYQELTALQTQHLEANKVHDLLVGEYPDSLVVFNPKGSVQVYVEASTLTPDAAVRVINLVSQTLGVASNQVSVTPHV